MRELAFTFKPELLPDREFDNPRGNRRYPFDPDRVGSTFDQILAGSAVRFEPEDLRDWLRGRSRPKREQAIVFADAVSELCGLQLRQVLFHCGGSARELAQLLRESGRDEHRWVAVSHLNSYTNSGPEELPFHPDKRSLMGHFL